MRKPRKPLGFQQNRYKVDEEIERERTETHGAQTRLADLMQRNALDRIKKK
jgi:hypothetical protein